MTTMAMTRRIWINPPMVYEETKPNAQRMMRITAIVSTLSMFTRENH